MCLLFSGICAGQLQGIPESTPGLFGLPQGLWTLMAVSTFSESRVLLPAIIFFSKLYSLTGLHAFTSCSVLRRYGLKSKIILFGSVALPIVI